MYNPDDNKVKSAWKYFNTNNFSYGSKEEREIILVASNLDMPENIGGLIRAAGNVGCVKVIFTGDITDFKETKIRRSATNGYEKVDWQFCKEEEWPQFIPEGFTKVAVETSEGATDIYATELPNKIVFVVGNESYGIKEWSVDQCDMSVYIPMPGVVKSLNVNQAGTLAMFEWWRRDYILNKD